MLLALRARCVIRAQSFANPKKQKIDPAYQFGTLKSENSATNFHICPNLSGVSEQFDKIGE